MGKRKLVEVEFELRRIGSRVQAMFGSDFLVPKMDYDTIDDLMRGLETVIKVLRMSKPRTPRKRGRA